MLLQVAHIFASTPISVVQLVYMETVTAIDVDAGTVRRRIAQALNELIEHSGIQKQLIAKQTGRAGASVTHAINNGVDSVLILREYEQALGLPYGTILLRAGVIEQPADDVHAAIMTSPHLDKTARDFLASAYQLAADASTARAASS